jgi:hypothetical protein
MGLEVYYPQDISNALSGAHLALVRCNENRGLSQDFINGYLSALDIVSACFGIPTNYVIGNVATDSIELSIVKVE